MILTKTEKAFDKMIGNSSCKTPYQTQSDNPVIKTKRVITEISSAFFSFKTLISCGIIATEVIPPAINPSTSTFML